MKSITKYKAAFTLVEIMIVVALIGMLAAIAVPTIARARIVSQRNACIANLKQLEGAKATWALEQKKTSTDIPALTELYGSINTYIRDEVYCPANGIYDPQAVQTKATCTEATTMGHTL